MILQGNGREALAARVKGRKEADSVADFVFGEIEAAREEGGDAGDTIAAAFVERFRHRWEEKFPPPEPKAKPARQSMAANGQDVEPNEDVDETVYHRVDINGYCRRHTAAAVMFETQDKRTFWVPLKCIKIDVPATDDYVQFLDVPGWKINEAGIQDLVYGS